MASSLLEATADALAVPDSGLFQRNVLWNCQASLDNLFLLIVADNLNMSEMR